MDDIGNTHHGGLKLNCWPKHMDAAYTALC